MSAVQAAEADAVGRLTRLEQARAAGGVAGGALGCSLQSGRTNV